MRASPDTICTRVLYCGHVQGVGFRWTTCRIASRHPVDGYVRNLPDGTVELVAQGPRPAINAFLAEVAQVMQNHIERADSVELDLQDDLAGFQVRR